MNETKVNTENADVTSSAPKNVLNPQYVGRIETPHGAQYVDRGASVSPLEQDYGLFPDRTIQAAGLSKDRLGAGPLMREMNRMHQVVAGLGVVLRIVGGNSVLEDEFDPADPGSAPPLSKAAVGMLTAMAASLCEEMCGDMERRAASYNSEVKS